jgi:hypothetical protein
MLAIIGSLAGFFSSFIPEIFHFLKDKKDKEHELKLINLQLEALKIGNSRLEEIQINANAEESKYLYYYASKTSKVKWVDALSSSVRPVITYTFFLLYATLKIIDFLNVGSMAPIWSDEDQGIFCAVIGFWFGQRAFSKVRFNGNGNGH